MNIVNELTRPYSSRTSLSARHRWALFLISLASCLLMATRASADSESLFSVNATFVNSSGCPGCMEDVTGSFLFTVVGHTGSVTDITLDATGTVDESDWTPTSCFTTFLNAAPFCFDATATGDELTLVFSLPIGTSGSVAAASTYKLTGPPHSLVPPPLKLSSGTYSVETPTAPTPEPPAVLLLLSGIATLVVAARIKRPTF